MENHSFLFSEAAARIYEYDDKKWEKKSEKIMLSYNLVISLIGKRNKNPFFPYKFHIWEVLGRPLKYNYNRENNNKIFF